MNNFFGQLWQILVTLVNPQNLRNPAAFQAAMNQPGVFWATLAAVNLVVFTETGLLIGFLLPGDSLLVVLGIVAHLSDWNVWLLVATLCVSAVAGDSVGYAIGAKAGPRIFSRPDGRFFRREYLLTAKAFFDRHGGKAIIFARFVPIVRTFVPVVAGAARMEYKRFLFFNVFGGIGWIVSMVLLGYYLIPLVEPPLQRVFGPQFLIAKNIDKVVVVVIGLSVLPIVLKAYKEWRAKRPGGPPAGPPPEAPEPVAAG